VNFTLHVLLAQCEGGVSAWLSVRIYYLITYPIHLEEYGIVCAENYKRNSFFFPKVVVHFPEILTSHQIEAIKFLSRLDLPREERLQYDDMIYLLSTIGLSPGGSTHLHTNNT